MTIFLLAGSILQDFGSVTASKRIEYGYIGLQPALEISRCEVSIYSNRLSGTGRLIAGIPRIWREYDVLSQLRLFGVRAIGRFGMFPSGSCANTPVKVNSASKGDSRQVGP